MIHPPKFLEQRISLYSTPITNCICFASTREISQFFVCENFCKTYCSSRALSAICVYIVPVEKEKKLFPFNLFVTVLCVVVQQMKSLLVEFNVAQKYNCADRYLRVDHCITVFIAKKMTTI